MSGTGGVHPYRERVIRELAETSADFLDEGAEYPFTDDVVDLSLARVYVKGAIREAEKDRRRVLAWMLRRYLATLKLKR